MYCLFCRLVILADMCCAIELREGRGCLVILSESWTYLSDFCVYRVFWNCLVGILATHVCVRGDGFAWSVLFSSSFFRFDFNQRVCQSFFDSNKLIEFVSFRHTHFAIWLAVFLRFLSIHPEHSSLLFSCTILISVSIVWWSFLLLLLLLHHQSIGYVVCSLAFNHLLEWNRCLTCEVDWLGQDPLSCLFNWWS